MYLLFGLKHKGYNNVINGTHHPYGFLNQEENEEFGLGWLTFRYRNYMPEIGRFFGVDPVSSEYMSISTYQIAHNNPVWKIELEGLEGQEKQGVDSQHHEPIKVVNKTTNHAGAGTVGTAVVAEPTKKAVVELSKSFVDDAGRLVLEGAKTTGKVSAGTILGAVLAILTPTPLAEPQPHVQKDFESMAAPNPNPERVYTDEPSDNDDGVVLHRGVPRVIPTSHTEEQNPAYIPALVGTAVPQDASGTTDPVAANKGVPSAITFWSTNPEVARNFATDGESVDGVVLSKRFPSSVLQNNLSPDKYNEGEIQIPGVVHGATPVIVTPR